MSVNFSSLRTMLQSELDDSLVYEWRSSAAPVRGQLSMEFKKVMPCPTNVAEAFILRSSEKVKAEKAAAKK
ncbi:hypothetical protein [Psychromonas algicola]|uniref:hypothetical protein n=1 Tax=Psychromonas algicola TaxID=2555642 RepID=UPI00106855DE|nr:hypothetical protein [Psychromonas sp. RZ5]TEW48506.1 hypothetical protein E2R67_11445 [Psychromonas sp. RZ5]